MQINPETIKQPFWALSQEETLVALKSSQNGLTEKEVGDRRAIFGPNSIREFYRITKFGIFINQFKNPLILTLLVSGLITMYLGKFIDSTVIFGAVLVNTLLGFWQENKTEEVLEHLKSYIRTRVRVLRDGSEKEIDSSELVPGDIIKIMPGNRITADARVMYTKNLEIDESVLTGESLPIEKNEKTLSAHAPLPERTSMIFGGTVSVKGIAEAVVTATGNFTEFGKIAELASLKERKPTPLQKSIAKFTAVVSMMLGVLVLLLFAAGISYGHQIDEMFLIAVAVAVSVVPEGLPIALTVILAIGVQRLAQKGGVVRKLLAAETLGSTTIILTDKTGTLTEAKMEVVSLLPYGNTSEKTLLEIALINTDALIENPNDNPANWKIAGTALDAAIIKSAVAKNITPQKLEIIEKTSFSSETKFAATIYTDKDGTKTVLLGAPEILIEKTLLERQEKEKIKNTISKMAYSGERILGVLLGEGEKFENLNFLGLLSLRDPIRQGVAQAIKTIEGAGIKTVIVTGDHQGTAEAVARELGMIDGKGAVLTGEDLIHLSDEELENRLDETTVFARVTPQDKMRLVKIFRKKGEIVAVTGDGINDALALKAADIGVAVGSGTDVAKSAADLVILGDNFETIVAAIGEGKRITANMKKVIVYLLSSSLDELFLIGGALATGIVIPLNALQILLVNFFSDSFPAVAFSFEQDLENHHDSTPPKKHNLFDRKMRFLILVVGTITSAMLFAIYFFMLKNEFDEKLTRTFVFASFATYTLFLAFSLRSLEKSIFSYNPFSNKYLDAGVIFGLIFTSAVIYINPLNKIFDLAPLPFLWILGVISVGLISIVAVEASKRLIHE